MKERPSDWWKGIADLTRETFSIDWETHLDQLNIKFFPNRPIEEQLMTVAPGLPPALFNGDIEELPADEWVLVLSHNPHINAKDEVTKAWYLEQHFTPETWWEYWRLFNVASPRWPKNFVPPLVRLASGSMGEPPVRRATRQYAHRRMLFAELCPYASERFGLTLQQTQQLIQDDIGFRIARTVREILIEQGRPALVMVQGREGIADLGALIDRVRWTETEPYPSRVRAKMHTHFEGVYTVDDETIPIVGFSKLGGGYRGTRSHGDDIDDLAARIRQFVSGIPRRHDNPGLR